MIIDEWGVMIMLCWDEGEWSVMMMLGKWIEWVGEEMVMVMMMIVVGDDDSVWEVMEVMMLVYGKWGRWWCDGGVSFFPF